METVLLVFDDVNELAFFESKLSEENVAIVKSNNLAEALVLAESVNPSLVIINTPYNEDNVVEFCKQIKTSHLNNITVLSLVESENYYSSPFIDHLMVRPIRPKLLLSIVRALMKNETVSWMPQIQ